MSLFSNTDRLKIAYHIGAQCLDEGSRDTKMLDALTTRITDACAKGGPTAGAIILVLVDMLVTTVDASVGASLKMDRELDKDNRIDLETEMLAGLIKSCLIDREKTGGHIKMTLGPDENGTQH